MKNLNSQQKDSVAYINGPLLVLAGAGTGKTTIITEKIVHLVDSFFAQPQQILAVTFTNKAANEMRHRVAEKIGDIHKNIWLGTFHAIALRILRHHATEILSSNNFNIIDVEDQFKILKKVIIDFEVDIKEYPVKNYQYQIERLKDKALLPEDISEQDNSYLPFFKNIYQQYQKQLQKNNVLDFGDILLYNIKIFQKNPDVAKYYKDKFSYILVDEYQDTNRAQYQWLLHIINNNENICCVGDDDQSIYSWRGAEIANILKLEKDFPKVKIIKLEENYRSTKNILEVAAKVIKENQDRHDKTLWTNNDNGNEVLLKSFESGKIEAQEIANQIKNYEGNLNDIAILFRAGYQTRIFEEVFINSSVAYKIIGGLRFYERKEIKDVISYLRIVLNPHNDIAFERIINLPRRGVGKVAMDKLLIIANKQDISLFSAIKVEINNNIAKKPLVDLVMQIENWQKSFSDSYNLADLARDILEDCGYLKMWQLQKTPEAQSRYENLQEFINSLKDFTTIEQFLEHISLISDSEDAQNHKPMVNLMTVHAAKGLEFENVFIPGLEEGIFPNSKSFFEPKAIEEERRLLYVAITRAKKNLFLSFALGRFKYGSWENTISSRFINNIRICDDDFSQGDNSVISDIEDKSFAIGSKVFHKKFGHGIIKAIEDNKGKIFFSNFGLKTIMLEFLI